MTQFLNHRESAHLHISLPLPYSHVLEMKEYSAQRPILASLYPLSKQRMEGSPLRLSGQDSSRPVQGDLGLTP